MHRSSINYNLDDDGIWLECNSCSWKKNMGFYPEIEALQLAWQEHINPVQANAVAAGMTPREAQTWEAVRGAASSYLRLTEDENHHPMEREEICHAFHVIQGWLGSRPFIRKIQG